METTDQKKFFKEDIIGKVKELKKRKEALPQSPPEKKREALEALKRETNLVIDKGSEFLSFYKDEMKDSHKKALTVTIETARKLYADVKKELSTLNETPLREVQKGDILGSKNSIRKGEHWIVRRVNGGSIVVEAGAKLTITDKSIGCDITVKPGGILDLTGKQVGGSIVQESAIKPVVPTADETVDTEAEATTVAGGGAGGAGEPPSEPPEPPAGEGEGGNEEERKREQQKLQDRLDKFNARMKYVLDMLPEGYETPSDTSEEGARVPFVKIPIIGGGRPSLISAEAGKSYTMDQRRTLYGEVAKGLRGLIESGTRDELNTVRENLNKLESDLDKEIFQALCDKKLPIAIGDVFLTTDKNVRVEISNLEADVANASLRVTLRAVGGNKHGNEKTIPLEKFAKNIGKNFLVIERNIATQEDIDALLAKAGIDATDEELGTSILGEDVPFTDEGDIDIDALLAKSGMSEGSGEGAETREGDDTDQLVLEFLAKFLEEFSESIIAADQLSTGLSDEQKRDIRDEARDQIPLMMNDATPEQQKDIAKRLEELGLLKSEAAAVPAGETLAPEKLDTIIKALAVEVGLDSSTGTDLYDGLLMYKDDLTDYEACGGLSDEQLAQVITEIERRAAGAPVVVGAADAGGAVSGGTGGDMDTADMAAMMRSMMDDDRRGAAAPAGADAGRAGAPPAPRGRDTADTPEPALRKDCNLLGGTVATVTKKESGAYKENQPLYKKEGKIYKDKDGKRIKELNEATELKIVGATADNKIVIQIDGNDNWHVIYPAADIAKNFDTKLLSPEEKRENELKEAVANFARKLTWKDFENVESTTNPIRARVEDIVRGFAIDLGLDPTGVERVTDQYYEHLLEIIEQDLMRANAQLHKEGTAKKELKALGKSVLGGGLFGVSARIVEVTARAAGFVTPVAGLARIGWGVARGFATGVMTALAQKGIEEGVKAVSSGNREARIRALWQFVDARQEDDSVLQNLKTHCSEALQSFVAFDARKGIALSDLKDIASTLSAAAPDAARNLKKLFDLAEKAQQREKLSDDELDERAETLRRVTTDGTLRELLDAVVVHEFETLAEGKELSEADKKTLQKHAILAAERKANALLGDLVVQQKFDQIRDKTKDTFRNSYLGQLLEKIPGERFVQTVLRSGVNGAIAGGIMSSDASVAALYMGLTRVSGTIREELLKREPGKVKTAATLLGELRGCLPRSEDGAIDTSRPVNVGLARELIIEARARIKLPDVKEADRVRIEEAIGELQRHIMKAASLEAVQDTVTDLLQRHQKTIDEAVRLAEEEHARKRWTGKEGLLRKYVALLKHEKKAAAKILWRAAWKGSLSAAAGAIGADVGGHLVDIGAGVYAGEVSFNPSAIVEEAEVTMARAVDRVTLGATDLGTSAYVANLEEKMSETGHPFKLADGVTADELKAIEGRNEREQAALLGAIHGLVEDGKLMAVQNKDGSVEYKTPEAIAEERAAAEAAAAKEAARAEEEAKPKHREWKLGDEATVFNERSGGRVAEHMYHHLEGYEDPIEVSADGAVAEVEIFAMGEGTEALLQKLEADGHGIDFSRLAATGAYYLDAEGKEGERIFLGSGGGTIAETKLIVHRVDHPTHGTLLEVKAVDYDKEGKILGTDSVYLKEGEFTGLTRGAVGMDKAADSSLDNFERLYSDVKGLDLDDNKLEDKIVATKIAINGFGEERVAAFDRVVGGAVTHHEVHVDDDTPAAKPGEQNALLYELGDKQPDAQLHGVGYDTASGAFTTTLAEDYQSLLPALDARGIDVVFPSDGDVSDTIDVIHTAHETLTDDPFHYDAEKGEIFYWDDSDSSMHEASLAIPGATIREENGHFKILVGTEEIADTTLSYESGEIKIDGKPLAAFQEKAGALLFNHDIEKNHTWVSEDGDSSDELAMLAALGVHENAEHKLNFGDKNEAAVKVFVKEFGDTLKGKSPEVVQFAFEHKAEVVPAGLTELIQHAQKLETSVGVAGVENAFKFEQQFGANGEVKFPADASKQEVYVDRPAGQLDLVITKEGVHAAVLNPDGSVEEMGPAVKPSDMLHASEVAKEAGRIFLEERAAKDIVDDFMRDLAGTDGATTTKAFDATWGAFVRDGVPVAALQNEVYDKLVAYGVVEKEGNQYVPAKAYLDAHHLTPEAFQNQSIRDLFTNALGDPSVAARMLDEASAYSAEARIRDFGKEEGPLRLPPLHESALEPIASTHMSDLRERGASQFADFIKDEAGWNWMGTQRDNLEQVHAKVMSVWNEMQKPEIQTKLDQYGITLGDDPTVEDLLKADARLKLLDAAMPKEEAAAAVTTPAPEVPPVAAVPGASPEAAPVAPETSGVRFTVGESVPNADRGSPTEWILKSVDPNGYLQSLEFDGKIYDVTFHAKDRLGEQFYKVTGGSGDGEFIKVKTDVAGSLRDISLIPKAQIDALEKIAKENP